MGVTNMKTIFKPWGKEEWLELNESYCYKRIYINAGYKTSYQYHNFKRETNYIISGQAEIWLENDNGVVEKTVMGPGDYFNVTPPKKHRVIALTDIILQEVSTPEVDDVIRIEDDTNRTDGKIDSEHKTPSVLIVCAGLGSRLKGLTKNINKTLLPINNRAIISHIIDKFPSNFEFVITLGYKGDSIKEYCQITHPNIKFTFVEIDKYEGEGTGPGYSALQCEKYLQKPFYFVMGDCLIDSPLPHIDGNWLGVHETSLPEIYSTVKVDDKDNITSVMNKDPNGYDLAWIGLSAIFDYEIFWNELKVNMKNGEIVSGFERAQNFPNFKIKKFKWLDTGNLDDLEKTKEYFKDTPLSIKKDTEEITYHDNDIFLKFTPNKEILNRRNIRASHLKDSIPEGFGVSDNFIYYNWNEGKPVYEIDKLEVFVSFLDTLKKKLNTQIQGNQSDIEKFYRDKTSNRMSSFIKKYGNDYYTLNYEINGVKRNSMENVYQNLDFSKLDNNPFYNLFHGDLQFDNVLYNENNNKFYYIDWRDSFGDSIDAGDVYYDLAKLYGGTLISYNSMKDDNKINLSEGLNSVTYNYPLSDSLVKFKTIYENWIIENNFDLKRVKLITGIIFLNMSPLHDGKFGKMLWFKAIEMLSDYDK
jgi:NDP-sugar pyrophosphorylase family protein/mannose-6-phosphate isomerase-like protein (cupin superfamily)